ncbi:MAG: hypothetical protein R3B67_01685 [Phycisphaerales bacterium]
MSPSTAPPSPSRDQFTDLIKSSPDDEITITYRRSPDADMNASVPKGGEGGEETTISVTLGLTRRVVRHCRPRPGRSHHLRAPR